jgi:hypothetical protein
VAMVVVSLVVAAKRRAGSRRTRAALVNDRDQARRENRKPKLAMPRTEPSAYSQSPIPALTVR